ncbi:MAG: fused MFS/spermidine synthase, partial [Planctomycetota bacterium]
MKPEPRAPGLLLWVAVAGAATMAVELSAVRMVSPWFGASSVVWTNVIGVILLALALGYLAGARWASRANIESTLAIALGASAVFTALLPLLAAPVCGWFMPQALRLDQAGALFEWGSLAATSLLFLLPAAALGTIGPLAVELASRRGARPGVAGGQVLCVSTLGSLVGTFSTTHVLLPGLGVSRTVELAALLLGTGSLALALGARVRGASGLILVLVLCAAGARVPPGPGIGEGFELLEARESSYQSVRAVRDLRGELRLLQVNEGLDSFQSVWRANPGALGPGFYYDAFALPAWWAGRSSGSWRVAVLGLGAGTTFRVLDGASPPGLELSCVGAEIDRVVVGLGERWFDLPVYDPAHRVFAGYDARSALRLWSGPFDEIVLDAYAHQTEIPAHLCSREAMQEMRAKLASGGWLAINVGGFSFEDPLLVAIAATASSAFESRVLVLRVGGSRNFVVFARAGLEPIDPSDPAAPRPDASLVHLWGPAQLPSGARWL